jgi:hypothetical protein
MRKARRKPQIGSGLPEDIDMLVQCQLFLKFPQEYDADHFAAELADYIVRTVRPRRLTPEEQGAMVRYYAHSRKTISAAAEQVADILGPTYSVEALKQNENRHSALGSGQLRAIRSASDEQLKHIEATMTPADRDALKRFGESVSRILKGIEPRVSKFRSAKNDIIARSVIEDE